MRRDALHNRERVLAAAVQVFGSHGPDAPVDELAEAAGVGMGTLYRHFPTKQSLVDAIVAPRRRALLSLTEAAREKAHGEGFEWLLLEVGQIQSEQPGCIAQLWDHSLAEREALDTFRERLGGLLADAQAAGRVRPELTPSDVSMIFWSVREIVRITRADAPQAWRRHLELLLAGLRPAADGRSLTHPPLTAAQAKKIMKAAA